MLGVFYIDRILPLYQEWKKVGTENQWVRERKRNTKAFTQFGKERDILSARSFLYRSLFLPLYRKREKSGKRISELEKEREIERHLPSLAKRETDCVLGVFCIDRFLPLYQHRKKWGQRIRGVKGIFVLLDRKYFPTFLLLKNYRASYFFVKTSG